MSLSGSRRSLVDGRGSQVMCLEADVQAAPGPAISIKGTHSHRMCPAQLLEYHAQFWKEQWWVLIYLEWEDRGQHPILGRPNDQDLWHQPGEQSQCDLIISKFLRDCHRTKEQTWSVIPRDWVKTNQWCGTAAREKQNKKRNLTDSQRSCQIRDELYWMVVSNLQPSWFQSQLSCDSV
jgi:hypothetical protein